MQIKSGEEVYAILVSGTPKENTEWFGEPHHPLQASRMNYKSGKAFRAHKHLMNPRIINRTEEAFVVISGKIAVDIFDDNQYHLGRLIANAGELVIVYKGYHLVTIVEDAVCFEIKAGQFNGYISEEKMYV